MSCTPGMRGCRRDCLHRAMVHAYRDARHAWEALREAEHHGMQLEDDDFAEQYPPVTFKRWLMGWC